MSYARDESRVDPDTARADEQARWQQERKQSLREQYPALATVIDARFADHRRIDQLEARVTWLTQELAVVRGIAQRAKDNSDYQVEAL